VLFPLAGLDSALYDRYVRIRAAKEALALARIQNSRRYLDGEITREEAIRWLMEHDTMRRDFAERAIRFDDRYRSYVINYGLGESMIRDWLAANGGGDDDPKRRWELFEELLVSPKMPEELVVTR
jgi:hypothetical protein